MILTFLESNLSNVYNTLYHILFKAHGDDRHHNHNTEVQQYFLNAIKLHPNVHIYSCIFKNKFDIYVEVSRINKCQNIKEHLFNFSSIKPLRRYVK